VNVFIVSASGGQKSQFWANFDCGLGLLCTTPFHRLGPNLVCYRLADLRYTLKYQMSSGSVYSVGKKTILPFFELRHLVVSPIGSSLRKLTTGAQLQTFPYPTASKSFLQ